MSSASSVSVVAVQPVPLRTRAQSLGSVVSKYFEGDYRNAVSFLVDQKQLSISDLEMLLNELKKRS